VTSKIAEFIERGSFLHVKQKKKWRKVKERDKEVRESEKSKCKTKTRRKGLREYVRWMTRPW
jgi:hypothetical protein